MFETKKLVIKHKHYEVIIISKVPNLQKKRLQGNILKNISSQNT